jgi:hypothetical protein
VHWQTAAVLLATWSCGAAVVDTASENEDRLDDVEVVLAEQSRLAALEEEGVNPLVRLPAPAGQGNDRMLGPGTRLRG